MRALNPRPLLACFALAACAAEPADDPKGGASPALEETGAPAVEALLTLGLGRTAFSPLTEEVGLVYGPQGGWHIEPALRVQGPGPEGLALRWEGLDATSGQLLTYPNTVALSERNVVRAADGSWERVGDLLIFDVSDDAEVLDRAVRVRAALTDTTGAPLAEVEATVQIICCG